jgi:hypothetical protein
MRMASYYCDPMWHDGNQKVEARFLILPLPEHRSIFINGYATCELHAGQALRIMLEKLKKVTVHEVNK